MSDDPVRKYLDAKRDFDAAYSRIQNLQQIISEVHSGLHRPFTFVVTNSKVNFAPEVTVAKTATLNATDLPNANEIAEAISGLQESYKKVESFWKVIPDADRKNITPPPGRR